MGDHAGTELEMDPSDLDLDEDLPVAGKRGPGGIIALLLLLAAAGAAYWYFANPSPDSLVKSGTVSLVQGQPGVAIEKYEAALAAAPQHVGAHRGMAKALAQKGDKAKAGEWLEKAYALPGLTEKMKRDVRSELADQYLKLAKSLANAAPDKYEAALVKAIEFDSRSPANALLARHLIAMAELRAKNKAYTEAADMCVRVIGLEAKSKTKEEAWVAEAGYRVKAFEPEFDREFAAKHKEALLKSKTYDADARRFGVKTVAEAPPRAGELPKLHVVRIKNLANKLAKKELLKFLGGLASASPDKLDSLPDRLVAWPQQTWTEGWARHPSRYELGVSIAYEDAVRLIYFMRHGDKLKAWKKKKLKRR